MTRPRHPRAAADDTPTRADISRIGVPVRDRPEPPAVIQCHHTDSSGSSPYLSSLLTLAVLLLLVTAVSTSYIALALYGAIQVVEHGGTLPGIGQ